MLRVEVEPSGEDFWKLDPIIDLINRGAVGVIPTDTVYAARCFSWAFLSFILKSHTPTAIFFSIYCQFLCDCGNHISFVIMKQ